MRIIHVIANMEIGGAQRLLADLLPIQSEKNEVSLLMMKPVSNQFTKQLSDAGVKLLTIDARYYYNPFNVFGLMKLTDGYDIVHVHLTPAVYVMALVSLLSKRRILLTEHSTNGRLRRLSIMRGIERWVYGRYGSVISISEQTQTALEKWLGKAVCKFTIIPNGVNVNKFSGGNHLDKNSLVMVSRFAKSKDQDTVIKAIPYLRNTIKVLFVGDGERLEYCRTLAENLGVLDRIEFLGMQDNIPSIIKNAYLGIQSSHWEGFGLSAVEMMATGMPVVASDVDGLKQVVEGAGVLFRTGDEKDLAEKIEKLLNDKVYYKGVAEACKDRSMMYSIQKMAEGYDKLYKEMLYEK